jgi:predicted NBD/HSP70 family sugar kinase
MVKIKDSSHRLVLNSIRLYKEISAAQLSRITGFQPSTLVYIIRALEKEGLIKVSRKGTSSHLGGKPPILWELASEKGEIVGLEILPLEIRTIVIDFAGNILHQERIENIDNKNGNIDQNILYAIETVVKNFRLHKKRLLGVGIGIPGLVDRIHGIINYSVPLAVRNVKLKTMLQKKLRLPLIIANDANTGAVGVKFFYDSAAEFPHNIVYLTINERFHGIGAGLIIERRLFEGRSYTAGEICSDLPNLDQLAKQAFQRFGTIPEIYADNETPPMSVIAKSAKNNNPVSQYILESVTEVIASELLRIIGFLNPDLVVIGGDIAEAQLIIYDYVIPKIREKVTNFYPKGIVLPEIVRSRFGIYSVAVGATALVLREIFQDNDHSTEKNI